MHNGLPVSIAHIDISSTTDQGAQEIVIDLLPTGSVGHLGEINEESFTRCFVRSVFLRPEMFWCVLSFVVFHVQLTVKTADVQTLQSLS